MHHIVPEGFDLDRYIQEGEFSTRLGEPMRLERRSAMARHSTSVTALSADQVLTTG